jgi:hypothetical protein
MTPRTYISENRFTVSESQGSGGKSRRLCYDPLSSPTPTDTWVPIPDKHCVITRLAPGHSPHPIPFPNPLRRGRQQAAATHGFPASVPLTVLPPPLMASPANLRLLPPQEPLLPCHRSRLRPGPTSTPRPGASL